MINPLSDAEKLEIKSRSIYWREVRERDNQSPLFEELAMMKSSYGSRLLELLEFAANK